MTELAHNTPPGNLPRVTALALQVNEHSLLLGEHMGTHQSWDAGEDVVSEMTNTAWSRITYSPYASQIILAHPHFILGQCPGLQPVWEE